MPVFDVGFKVVARASGRELAEVAGLSCSRWSPIVSEVQVTERFADRAFRATHDGQRCVVYFEAYTRWKQHALWNVLAKAGMLSERERLPTVAVLYILRPRGYKDRGGEFLLQVGTQPTQKLWYFPVPLWQQKPAAWWAACPGLMTLYPLTHHGQPARAAGQYAADAIRSVVPESGLQADLLASLAAFGGLAQPQIDWFELIGRQAMEESKVFRKLFAAEQREGRRKAIREFLVERFGKEAAKTVFPLLAEVDDEKELAHLTRLAARCTRIQDFRAGLTET